MATYYTDKTLGDNSNDGLSEGNAWEHCPGMQDWDGVGTISPNDTVKFKKGEAWSVSSGTHVLDVTGGVTYTGDDWGSGAIAKLELTANGISRGIIMFLDDDATYETVVDAFECDGNGHDNGGGNIVGIGFGYPSGANLQGTTKRAINCTVHDIGDSGTSGWAYGILIGGLSSYATENVEVINNEVYNTARGGLLNYISASTASSDNVLIRGNEIHHTGLVAGFAYGLMLKNYTKNTIMEFNYCHDLNIPFISETTGSGYTGAEDCIVRYNIANGCSSDGLVIKNNGNRSIDFYGNIIINQGQYAININANLVGTISLKFYNNTFFESQGSRDVQIFSNSATFSALEFKNNIVCSRSGASYGVYDTDGDITAHSNNVYYKASGTLVHSNGTNYTAATIKGGYEASCQTSDPNFENTSNPPTGFAGTYGTDMEPNTDGFSIQSGDAINNGADLGLSYNGAINLSGKSGGLKRPQGLGWDIGAYELLSDQIISAVGDIASTEAFGGTLLYRINRLYEKGREAFLGGDIAWLTDTIKAVLVDGADYTLDLATHDFLNDIPSAAQVAISDALSGKSVTLGVADADDLTISGVSGDQFEYIVLFKDTGDSATSPLIICIDSAVGLPFTPEGGSVKLKWNNGANKIFKL